MKQISNHLQYKNPLIYLIKNKINGRIYIGQTQYFPERFQQHKAGYNKSTHIARAIKKHGVDNFDWYCLEECDISLLNEREQFYLDLFNSYDKKIGYNSSKEAKAPRGWKHSESFYIKKREWFNNNLHPMKGKKANPDAVNKMKVSLTGRKLSDSQLVKHYKFPPKRVKMFNTQDNSSLEFNSVTEAAIYTKTDKASITRCCKGERKTVYKIYTFNYIN